MDKSAPSPRSDITTERYKGPSVASATAGEGFIAHLTMGFGGLIAGGIAAFLMPKQVLKIEESLGKFHLNNKEHANWLVRAPAHIAGFTIRGINYITEHTPTQARNWLENKIGHQDRFRATVFGGSTLGAFGYFILPVMLGPRGARKGIEGRKQFERAKDEIITLRQQMNEKDEELQVTRAALKDAKTANAVSRGLVHPTLDTGAETTPVVAAADEASSHAAKFQKPDASWSGDITAQKSAQAEAEHAL